MMMILELRKWLQQVATPLRHGPGGVRAGASGWWQHPARTPTPGGAGRSRTPWNNVSLSKGTCLVGR